MPTVLEDTTVSLERTDLLRRSPIHKPVKRGRVVESTRAEGMHLSGVLRYIALTTGLIKAVEDIDQEALPLRMALGFAWEEFAVSLYPDIAWQPGEAVCDGIAMNCDGLRQTAISLDDNSDSSMDVTSLEEFKFTWKKAKTADEALRDEWYWMQQGRGYCWGYECNYVRWHICYANGDYRGSGPIYKRYLIHFNDSDIEKTRRMIEKNRVAAEGAGHAE